MSPGDEIPSRIAGVSDGWVEGAGGDSDRAGLQVWGSWSLNAGDEGGGWQRV